MRLRTTVVLVCVLLAASVAAGTRLGLGPAGAYGYDPHIAHVESETPAVAHAESSRADVREPSHVAASRSDYRTNLARTSARPDGYGSAPNTRLPSVIYREGTPRPGNLTPRPVDEGVLSFRDSLSNQWIPPAERPPNWRPVLRPGEPYIGIDTSRLPPGSVIPDNVPPGHVGVSGVSVDEYLEALIERGRFPK